MGEASIRKPLWLPRDVESTTVAKFINYVSKKHKIRLDTYDDLQKWSVHPDTIADFWRDAYIFLGLSGTDLPVGPSIVRQSSPLMYPPPTFFPTEKINFAEITLRQCRQDGVVIHFAREGVDGIEKITFADLKERVRQAYDALVSSGIQPGDKVAVVMSNSVNTIVLCLATLAIGAVWSSTSCESGVKSIWERYDQIKPKIIFADDACVYAGKLIKLEERIASWSHLLAKENDGLCDVVIVPYCNTPFQLDKVSHGTSWQEFIRRGRGRKLAFQLLPFSHPAFILFSSGTTGKPKCIIHSAGGVALKVKTDSQLQHDVRPTDTVFQYTTTAWVMWVLNFANLATGASMLLYDGSPFHPRPDMLLKLADEVGVSVFGTSPRYLTELRSKKMIPRERYKLEQLRTITSTGAVLSSDLFHWVYETAFPPRVHLISMSGGTDIAGSFVGGTPLLPVYAGEIQAKCLGMAIDIFDAAQEKAVSIADLGRPGELVCTAPFPSQPLAFYGADGPKKYEASYFGRFGKGVWCQGDFVQIYPDTGGIVMLGRSDGVLNPSGVRFGSADIYSVTETFGEIDDAICVGQRREFDEDERVLLFIKLKPPHTISSDLVTQIKSAIRERYSPRHVPAHIFEVAEIPYTVNGKKCEINVKQIVSGRKTEVSGTVANPASFALYEKYFYLKKDGKIGQPRESKL